MATYSKYLQFLHTNGSIIQFFESNTVHAERLRKDPEYNEIKHIFGNHILLKNGVELTFDEIEDMRKEAKTKKSNCSDTKGLRQCKRCGRWFSILYPLQACKAHVDDNGLLDVEERKDGLHLICEDCYDDFFGWVDSFLDYKPSKKNWDRIFKHDEEQKKIEKELDSRYGIKED